MSDQGRSPGAAASVPDARVRRILILALGGEGGGTLTQWLVQAGLDAGWPIQSTSIPGVAQRTGSTSYYVECLPRPLAAGEPAPTMCLAPLAGDIDLLISSEWLETARAVERGLPSADRTWVISSTARALTVEERTAMADGRYDPEAIEQAVRGAAQTLTLMDMAALARREGTVVSAVMFGALAASGVLPLALQDCERVVAAEGGARAQASIRGLRAGWQTLLAPPATDPPPRDAKLTLDLETLLRAGAARLLDHQDEAYARQYVQLVRRFAARDDATQQATRKAARYLALWMAYEDVIRVADLKSRRARFDRLRTEYGAKAGEPLVVNDFLKPGIDEIAALLPPRWAARLSAWAQRRGVLAFGDGLQFNTGSVAGLLAMRALSSLRPWRRRSRRFIEQQQAVARWTQALESALALPGDPQRRLAQAIAELPRLIKGYGATFTRGRQNFERIFVTLVEPGLRNGEPPMALAERIDTAASVALATPDGLALFDVLGLKAPPPREQPIRFVRPHNTRRQT